MFGAVDVVAEAIEVGKADLLLNVGPIDYFLDRKWVVLNLIILKRVTLKGER